MAQEYEVLNPATFDILATLKVPSQDDIDQALAFSRKAFVTWSSTPIPKRRAALEDLATLIELNKDRLAALLTQEQGKPLKESKREVTSAIAVFRQYSKMAMGEELVKDTDSVEVVVSREPYGVCALVLPWNYPLGLLSWKLAPCLLAGNTAVVKPSPHAPLVVNRCVELANSILPESVVQSLPGGDGSGRYLVSHGEVDKVSLTGSRETGREVLRAVSDHMPALSLELGGNDAAIVLPDCDIAKRFDSMFWGAFVNAGQICIAVKRLYVHERVLDEIVKRFTRKLEALKVGNGLDDGIEMGPLNNKEQLDRVTMLVDKAREDGANVTGGGAYDDERSRGYFYRPAVVTDIDDAAPLVTEEQFGPALPILAYSDPDEALARANGTGFGLGGSVWTEDVESGKAMARKIECGTVWVNAHMALELDAPFGGWKQSGMGRELGLHGLREFQQTRTVIWRK